MRVRQRRRLHLGPANRRAILCSVLTPREGTSWPLQPPDSLGRPRDKTRPRGPTARPFKSWTARWCRGPPPHRPTPTPISPVYLHTRATSRASLPPPPMGGCRFSVSARPHPQGKPLMPVLHPWRDGCQAAEHTAPSPAGTIRYAPAGFRMPAVLELASGSSAKATPLTGPASLLAPHPGRPRLPGMWPILPARTPLLALPPVRFHMHMFSRTSD